MQEPFENIGTGTYTGELLEFESSQTYIIPDDFELSFHWARPSATLALLDATSFTGDLHESAYEVTQQGSQIVVQASFEAFHVLSDAEGDPLDIWIPANPSELQAAYSAYFRNPAAVSVEKAENHAEFKIYPTPATDLVKIDWGNQIILEISLYNLQGQKIQTQSVQQGLSHDELDLSEIPSGTYIIALNGPLTTMTHKLIKIK